MLKKIKILLAALAISSGCGFVSLSASEDYYDYNDNASYDSPDPSYEDDDYERQPRRTQKRQARRSRSRDCYEVLEERVVKYRGDKGERAAQGMFMGAGSGALLGGIAGGGRGAGIGAGVGAGLGMLSGAASGSRSYKEIHRTCRTEDGEVFTQIIPYN